MQGLGGLGVGGMRQAAAVSPVASLQTANRRVISVRESSAVSPWRRDRKCGEITLNTTRNRSAAPGLVIIRRGKGGKGRVAPTRLDSVHTVGADLDKRGAEVVG